MVSRVGELISILNFESGTYIRTVLACAARKKMGVSLYSATGQDKDSGNLEIARDRN